MAQSTPGSIAGSASTIVRTVATPAAEPSTIDDSAFPPASDVVTSGWRSVLVTPRFTGGTAPTVALQVLRRAGAGWVACETTGALADGAGVIVDVNGRETFFRLDAVTGSPSSLALHVAGWEPFVYGGGAKR